MTENIWTLDDLTDKNNLNREPPSQENLLSLLEELYLFWKEPNLTVNLMLTWACEQFDVQLDETFKFDGFQNRVKWRVYEIDRLHNMLVKCEVYMENSEAKEKRDRILYVIRDARDLILKAACLYHRLDESREANLPDTALPTETFFNFDEQKNTTFQNLILHVLELLRVAEYRRMDDFCYQQRLTSSEFGEYATHAWEPKIRIVDFLHENVRKEIDFQQWRNLTNPRDNAKFVTEHLCAAQHVEFPAINPNRFLWSYRNGLYNIEDDFFWPFFDREFWTELAAPMQEYRRQNGWGEDYTLSPPTNDDVSIKYFDIDFRPYGEDPTPQMSDDDLANLQRMTPEKEKNFKAFEDLPTPNFDKLMSTQKLEGDVLKWIFIMIARCLYPVGKLDRWQVILFVKGVAGSGKSTIAKILRTFFPPNLVSTLSANIEAKFGLSAIYKSLLCVCSEVREDFGLNQADWQSAASGEEVTIAIKNQTAIQKKWDIPMFFAGNELPKYTNAAGSVDRRIFMVEFNNKVDGSDPFLFEKIEANIDILHRKLVNLYITTIQRVGHKDIWTPGLLPSELIEFKERMRRAVDPLCAFLDSGLFRFEYDSFCQHSTFLETFNQYVRENNMEKKKWCRDFYQATFDEKGLAIDRRQITTNGVTQMHKVIRGIEIIEGSSA